jgi:hypothetical protein
VDDLHNWLLPVCERLMASTEPHDQVLDKLPVRFRLRAEFVRSRMETVEKTERKKRFTRLKNPKPKAKLLAAALADHERAPTYAIQKSEERSRSKKPPNDTKKS